MLRAGSQQSVNVELTSWEVFACKFSSSRYSGAFGVCGGRRSRLSSAKRSKNVDTLNLLLIRRKLNYSPIHFIF